MKLAGIANTPETPVVFCAVRAVMTAANCPASNNPSVSFTTYLPTSIRLGLYVNDMKVNAGRKVATLTIAVLVTFVEDLQAALIDRKQGDTVTLKVWRAGQTRDVTITLDASSFQ